MKPGNSRSPLRGRSGGGDASGAWGPPASGAGQCGGGARDRRRCLPVLLSARHHGSDPQAAHQCRAGQRRAGRPSEHVRQHSGVPERRHEGRGPAQLRYALFQRVARPHRGARDRLGARHERALLPAADARHVDERVRVARLAHHGHAGGQLRHHSARLAARAIQAPRGRSADRRAHPLRLDHRPHQDRRPAGLRRRPQDPGGLQDHAAVALGQGARTGRGQDRSERRHEDAAENPGRPDAGRRIFRLRGRAHEAAAAAHHGSADHRAAASGSASSPARASISARPIRP